MNNIIKKDELFIITAGEYSDYGIRTICKAKKRFNIDEIEKKYLELYPEQKESYKFKEIQFIKYLIIDKGLAKEINVKEFNLGYYSDGSFSINNIDKII